MRQWLKFYVKSSQTTENSFNRVTSLIPKRFFWLGLHCSNMHDAFSSLICLRKKNVRAGKAYAYRRRPQRIWVLGGVFPPCCEGACGGIVFQEKTRSRAVARIADRTTLLYRCLEYRRTSWSLSPLARWRHSVNCTFIKDSTNCNWSSTLNWLYYSTRIMDDVEPTTFELR